MFDHEGITTAIRQAFVVYLASCSRPMSELLLPNQLDREDIFHEEFVGMTNMEIDYDTLCQVRKRLIKDIQESLSKNEREFLISIKSGEPQWELMPIPHLSKLPAVQWKVLNIQKMDASVRSKALNKLKNSLGF